MLLCRHLIKSFQLDWEEDPFSLVKTEHAIEKEKLKDESHEVSHNAVKDAKDTK